MWCWFKSNHEEIRTLVLLVAAVVGFTFAWWRAWIADGQAGAAERASRTAEQNRLNEQFRSGVELFTHAAGNSGGSLVKRLGGASALAELAKLYPEEMHVRIMDLFVAFLRYNPSVYGGGPNKDEIDFGSPDNRAVVNAINARTEEQKAVEAAQEFDLEQRLRGTDFALENGKIPIEEAVQAAGR